MGKFGRRAEVGLRCLLTYEEKLYAEVFGYTDLRLATAEATLYGKRAGSTRYIFLSKLDEALVKLVQGKPKEALAKLKDFHKKMKELYDTIDGKKPKIDENDAIYLLAATADAIAALKAL